MSEWAHRFRYDGETVEVIERAATTIGNEVVLKDGRGRLLRLALKELLFSDRAQVVPDQPGPSADDAGEIASVVLDQLDEVERHKVAERAGHVREVLTRPVGAGSPELAIDGEPRVVYAPSNPAESRYAAKAQELGVSVRSVEQWVA